MKIPQENKTKINFVFKSLYSFKKVQQTKTMEMYSQNHISHYLNQVHIISDHCKPLMGRNY